MLRVVSRYTARASFQPEPLLLPPNLHLFCYLSVPANVVGRAAFVASKAGQRFFDQSMLSLFLQPARDGRRSNSIWQVSQRDWSAALEGQGALDAALGLPDVTGPAIAGQRRPD